MAKRYGRNQRRRHREERALLAMLLRQSRASLAHESEARLDEKRQRLEQEERVQQWAGRIRTALGPDHPINYQIARRMVPAFRGEIEGRLKPPAPRAPREGSAYEPMPIHEAETYLRLAVHRIAMNPQTLPPGPRVTLELMVKGSKEVAYAVDEAHLREAREDPRFLEWMTGRIAEELHGHLHPEQAEAA